MERADLRITKFAFDAIQDCRLNLKYIVEVVAVVLFLRFQRLLMYFTYLVISIHCRIADDLALPLFEAFFNLLELFSLLLLYLVVIIPDFIIMPFSSVFIDCRTSPSSFISSILSSGPYPFQPPILTTSCSLR